MATREYIDDALVRIDGVELSEYVKSVAIVRERAELPSHAMGSVGEEVTLGLRKESFEITFFQSYDAQKVDDVLEPLYQDGSTFFVYVQRDNDTALSATNPAWQGQCKLPTYSPLTVEHGNLAEVTVRMPVATGKIFRIESGTYS